MLIIINFTLVEEYKGVYKVVNNLPIPLSPCCQAKFNKYGTRSRTYIDEEEQKNTLHIRVLRCEKCGKIHRELPDFIVPYRRHCAPILQRCIDAEKPADFPIAVCSTPTVYKFKKVFFDLEILLLKLLQNRRAKFVLPYDFPLNSMQEYRQQNNWLSRLVFELVNHGFWKRTSLRGLSEFYEQ
ncbi:MAG: DUF6431 domain-containing protein [Deltaproteobacteria bacterium]|jgi:hypothetical protein|nr:DUF6431 domain-containing protein [Deltaproteobacteria bacterium]